MKSQKEIEKMYRFISGFNDGEFMNQDYRKGIIDAFAFALYEESTLNRITTWLKDQED